MVGVSVSVSVGVGVGVGVEGSELVSGAGIGLLRPPEEGHGEGASAVGAKLSEPGDGDLDGSESLGV